MEKDLESFEEFEDLPDEQPDERELEQKEFLELVIPEVYWADQIKDIEDPEIRHKETVTAYEILEKEQRLNEKLDAGEITDLEYWETTKLEIQDERVKAKLRSTLSSVSPLYDDVVCIAEHYDHPGHKDIVDLDKEGNLLEAIDKLGLEGSQEQVDRMLSKGEISKEAHQAISRHIQLNEK